MNSHSLLAPFLVPTNSCVSGSAVVKCLMITTSSFVCLMPQCTVGSQSFFCDISCPLLSRCPLIHCFFLNSLNLTTVKKKTYSCTLILLADYFVGAASKWANMVKKKKCFLRVKMKTDAESVFILTQQRIVFS